MLLGARQFFERRGAKLPYDAEVEYLESSGTQYIDTGIRPAQDLSFVVKFDNLNINIGYGNVFGSRLSSNNNEYQVTCYNNGSVGVGTRYSFLGFYTNVVNIISYDGSGELNINGNVRQIVPQSCESANGNIVLFGISQNGVVSQLSNCRIYNAKFGSARDMIPVRFTNELGQSEGAMYDRVSGKLFRNQGTGSFAVGRDVNPISARSYVNDGLVAMWDGIENAGWGTHDASATVWKDLVGTNDLRLYGNCAFADNRLILSRSNSDAAYVKADDATVVSSANGMTIEYVFRPVGFHNYSALVQFLPYSQTREGWIYSDGRCVPLRWGYQRGEFLVSNDEDVYVAAVIDNSDFKMKYYKNAVEASSGIAAANKTENCTMSFFGANESYFFLGDAYAMRLHNRALTSVEIAANYAIDKARFNLP